MDLDYQINNILKRAKSTFEPKKTANTNLDYPNSIKIDNSVKINDSTITIISGMNFFFYLLFSIFAIYFINTNIFGNMKISNYEILSLQSQIKTIALCENISVNKKHQQLRKQFNYQSYKNLSKRQMDLVLKELERSSCYKN